MTNQNDTQDETEKLAEEAYPDTRIMGEMVDRSHERMVYVDGYRAGLATKEAEIAEWKKRHSHLASGCDEMMTVQAALREENAKLKEWQQEDKDNDKLFCKWRDDLEHENSKLETENERLKESLSAVTVIQQRDAAIKQLAAEKARSKKLVEALEIYANRVCEFTGGGGRVFYKNGSDNPPALPFYSGEQWELGHHAEKALSAYNTDSGDGEG